MYNKRMLNYRREKAGNQSRKVSGGKQIVLLPNR
jgi:hypothetical protein